jgi:hypothetical protein
MQIPVRMPRVGIAHEQAVYYEKFVKERRRRLETVPFFSQLLVRIHEFSQGLADLPGPDKQLDDQCGISFRAGSRPLSVDVEGIAVFITEILSVTRHWDVITAQWMVFRKFYGGFLQQIELVAEIASLHAYLPIIEAQKRFLSTLSADRAPGFVSELHAGLSDVGSVVSMYGNAPVFIVCGVYLVRKLPVPGVNPYRSFTNELYKCSLENPVLIMLKFAASCLRDFFRLTDDLTLGRVLETLQKGRKATFAGTMQMIHPEPSDEGGNCRFMAFDCFNRTVVTAAHQIDTDLDLLRRNPI